MMRHWTLSSAVLMVALLMIAGHVHGAVELYEVKASEYVPAFVDYRLNCPADVTVSILPSDAGGVPSGPAIRTVTLSKPRGFNRYIWLGDKDDLSTAPVGYYVAQVSAATTQAYWDPIVGLFRYNELPPTSEITFGAPPPPRSIPWPADGDGFYDIACNSRAASPYYGRIYVSNKLRAEIYMYGPDGQFLGALDDSAITWPIGGSAPWTVSVADDDYVYVTDRTSMRIYCFTPAGALVSSGACTNSRGAFARVDPATGITHIYMTGADLGTNHYTVSANHLNFASVGIAYDSGQGVDSYGMWVSPDFKTAYQANVAGPFIGVTKWDDPDLNGAFVRDTGFDPALTGKSSDVTYVGGPSPFLWVTSNVVYQDDDTATTDVVEATIRAVRKVNPTTGAVDSQDPFDIVTWGHLSTADAVGNLITTFGKAADTWGQYYWGVFAEAGASATSVKSTVAFYLSDQPAPVIIPNSAVWTPDNELIANDSDSASVTFKVMDINGYADITSVTLDLRPLGYASNAACTLAQDMSDPTNKTKTATYSGIMAKVGTRCTTSPGQPPHYLAATATDSTAQTNVNGTELSLNVIGERTEFGLPALSGYTVHSVATGWYIASANIVAVGGGIPGATDPRAAGPFTYTSDPTIDGFAWLETSSGTFHVTGRKVGFGNSAEVILTTPYLYGAQNLYLRPLTVAEARNLPNGTMANIEGVCFAQPMGVAPTLADGLYPRLDTLIKRNQWYMCDANDPTNGMVFMVTQKSTSFVFQWDDVNGKEPFPRQAYTSYMGKRPAVGETIMVTGLLDQPGGHERRTLLQNADIKNALYAVPSQISQVYLNRGDLGGLPTTPVALAISDIYHPITAASSANWGKFGRVTGATVIAYQADGVEPGVAVPPTTDPVPYLTVANVAGNTTMIAIDMPTSLGNPTIPAIGSTYTFTGAVGRRTRYGQGCLRIRSAADIVFETTPLPIVRVRWDSPGTGSPSTYDGKSWETAFHTVREGLNAAASGGEIWVAQGTYEERITLRDGVRLYGGFDGTESEREARDPRTHVTILDGSNAGSVVTSPEGTTASTVIDGFTIRNGSAVNGGGIECVSSSPTIANNRITGNIASSAGGGIHCNLSSATISSNVITANEATLGGGIVCYDSSPSIRNNILADNSVTGEFGGGAIGVFGSSVPILTGNTICGNNATSGKGGGIYAENAGLSIKNSILWQNQDDLWNCTATYSCVTDLVADPGTGNISVDPAFIQITDSLLAGYYRLSAGSLCNDKGDATYVSADGEADIDGEQRIVGGLVDIGADETPDTGFPDTHITSGPADEKLVCSLPVSFSWAGSDDTTPIELQYAWRLDGGEWSAWSTQVDLNISVLSDGSHTLEVAARDAAGNVDQTPAVRAFVVDTSGPEITSVSSAPEQSSCTVTWTTDEAATSQVEYGLTTSHGSETTEDTDYVTTHSVALAGLAPSTTYHFCVRSENPCGNLATTGDYTFTTAADTAPPDTEIISGPAEGTIVSTNPVTMIWTGTDDITPPGLLEYSWRLDAGDWSAWSTVTSQALTLADGQHTFEVKARDAAGNEDASPASRGFRSVPKKEASWRFYVTADDGAGGGMGQQMSLGVYPNSVDGVDTVAPIQDELCTFVEPPVLGFSRWVTGVLDNDAVNVYTKHIQSPDSPYTYPLNQKTWNLLIMANVNASPSPIRLYFKSTSVNPSPTVGGKPFFFELVMVDNKGVVGAPVNGTKWLVPIPTGATNSVFWSMDTAPDSTGHVWGNLPLLKSGISLTASIMLAQGYQMQFRMCGYPDVTYVKSDSLGPVFDGKSWETAFHSVQEGLNAAASGGEVWVAQGTYDERITLKEGVALYGGYAGEGETRSIGTYITTLDGDQAGSVVTVPAGVTGSTCIDGFTIRNGSGTLLDGKLYGGGIFCGVGCAPTIRHNHIVDNTADVGAGMYAPSADPKLHADIVVGAGCRSTGAVELIGTSAPAGGYTVNLMSNDPSLLTVPATVTIPQGQTFVEFNIVGVSPGTTQIMASASGFTDTDTVSVVRSTIDLSVPSQMTVGASGSGTVLTYVPGGTRWYNYCFFGCSLQKHEFTNQWAEPTLTVSLSSENPAAIQVPVTTSIAAGNQSATFGIQPVGAGSSTVTASSAGWDNETPSAIEVVGPKLDADITVGAGCRSTGIVELVGATAPTGGYTVNLTSSAPTVASVPATVTIPQNERYVQFTITGLSVGTTQVQLSAGGFADTDAVSVVKPTFNLSIYSQMTVGITDSRSVNTYVPNGTYWYWSSSLSGTVKNSSTSQIVSAALTVSLSSENPSVIQVPASVTIPAGRSYTDSFTIRAVGTGTSTITASAAGWDSKTTGAITTTGPVLWSDVTLGVGTRTTGVVSLTGGYAASGGFTVTLTSDDPSIASVPATVTVPQGQYYVPFNIVGHGVGSTTIRMSCGTFAEADSVTVAKPTFQWSDVPSQMLVGETKWIYLYTNIPDGSYYVSSYKYSNTKLAVDQSMTINLSADTAGAIQVPATVTIPSGNNYVSFSIQAVGTGTSTVTASATNWDLKTSGTIAVSSASGLVPQTASPSRLFAKRTDGTSGKKRPSKAADIPGGGDSGSPASRTTGGGPSWLSLPLLAAIGAGVESDSGQAASTGEILSIIEYNTFSGNVAGTGGGIACYNSSPIIRGNIFVNNSATGEFGGGALAVFGSSAPTLTGNTICGNNATSGRGGGIYAENVGLSVRNSILWQNQDDLWNCVATYSCVTDLLADPGTGNISADPAFTQTSDPAAAGYYRLESGSPCINAGDPAYSTVAGETDIDGGLRITEGRLDIGADESPDVTSPDTQVTFPAEGEFFCSLPVSLGWTGVDDTTHTSQLQYSWRMDGGAWSDWSSSTSVNIADLADGAHTFEVKAKDLSGNADPTPAARGFLVSTSPPQLSGVGAGATQSGYVVNWTTDKPATSQVEYGLTDSYGSATPLHLQMVTNHSVTIAGLLPNMTYHYRVRSIEGCGRESVSTDGTFSTAPDTTPPDTSIISGPAAGVTVCSLPLSFAWTGTDDFTPTLSLKYSYRLDSQAWTESASDTGITIDSLTHGVHTLQVKASDAVGNEDASPASRMFALDTTSPAISSVASTPGVAQCTITWTTDEPSTSQVEYGSSTAYGTSTPMNSQKVTGHSVTVTGLSPATPYHYRVKSADACGHESTSTDEQFTTGPDNTPPDTFIVSGPTGGTTVCQSTLTFAWSGTDAATPTANLSYSWRLDSVGWSETTSGTGTVLQELANGLHTFEVRATDTSGNTDPTPVLATFRVDTDVPTASDVSITVQAGTGTVSWHTSKPTDARVEYGKTTAYGQWSLLDSRILTSHAVMLVGLEGDTTYHYRIHSKDSCGRDLVSEPDRTFDTATDSQPPDTTITSGVVEGAVTCPTSVKFAFSGTDDYTLPANLQHKWQIDSGGWQGPISEKIVTLPTLSHGSHKFEVASQDGAGNVDPAPAVRNFLVDATEPVTSNVRAEQISSATATIRWDTDDPTTSLVEYRRIPDGVLAQTQLYSQYAQGHTIGLLGLTPDSDYHYRARSKDHCDREEVSEFYTLHTLPDTQAPDTAITSGPRNGGSVKPGSVTFRWTGVDDTTPAERLKFQYQTDGEGWSPDPAGSATTQTVTGLTAGSHVFDVRAVDEAGHVDQTPAHCEFSMDETAPTVGAPSVSDITYISALVTWTTNEPTTGVVEYALADGEYKFTYADYSLRTSHSMGIGPLSPNTPFKVRVRSNDEAGNESVSSETVFVSGKLCDIAVFSQDLTWSNLVPAAGDPLAILTKVRNLGDIPVSATAIFYDWSSQTGNKEISRQQITDLPAHSDVDLGSADWNVLPEGNHTPWVQLVNVLPADNIPGNNSVGKNLTVGPPPYRLALSVSNAKCWVGGEGLFTVLVKNTGSRGQVVTDAQVIGAPWVTRLSDLQTGELQPGQEMQITFQMNVPIDETGGPVGAPVLKPVTLQITGSDTYEQGFSIELYQAALADVAVTVIDGVSGLPIQNAVVAISSSEQQWYTDSQGKVGFACTIGSQGIYAVAQDHLPEMVNLDVAQGSNPVVIRLQPGQPLEVREISVTPLTPDEIRDRGVNLSDPTNYWVYDFMVYLDFAAIPIRNIVLPTNPTPGQRVSPGFVRPDPGSGWSGPTNVVIRPEMYYPKGGDSTQRVETWIIVPGDIRILKQFWEATVYVRNNCREPFVIENVEASLQIPNGISLPDLNGVPQQITRLLGTIPAQTEKQASWVVRGDAAGRYTVTGTAVGDIVLGGSSVRLESSLESPEFEVVQPKLDVLFVLPECVRKGEEFVLGINVTNRSSIELHGVSVNIHRDMLYNAQIASGESASKTIGSIAVGETKNVSFRFISEIDGTTNGQWSYATADPNIQPEVRVLPADAIRLTKTVVPDIAPPGSEVRYVIIAQNAAEVIANNIHIEDVLPPGVEYTPSSASPDASYDSASRTLRWTFPSMPVGATQMMSFRATIGEDTALCTEINNIAERVTACSRVPSNPCLLRVDEPGRPWLRLQNSADKSVAEFGDELTYTLTIHNDSSVPALDVRLSDAIPDGCSYVPDSANEAGQYDSSAKELSWGLGTLAAGAEEAVSFRIRLADSDASGQITNSAVCQPSNGCPAHAESVVAVAAVNRGLLIRANLHVHTSASGGDHTNSENAWDTLSTAYRLGLDGIGFSDHDGISDSEWTDVKNAADAYTQSGALVAVRGFEWTWKGDIRSDHINVFGSKDRQGVAATDPLSTIYSWLRTALGEDGYGTPVAQFNHIQYGTQLDGFRNWDSDLDKIVTLAEIGCGPSPIYSQAAGNENLFVDALRAGWHVAPTIGIDNSPLWGINLDGYWLTQQARTRHTGVYVSARTQQAFMDSLRHRRTFASEDSDFLMRYTANLAGASYDMGSVIRHSGNDTTKPFTLVLSGSDSDDGIAGMEIRRGNPLQGDMGVATGDKNGGTGTGEALKWEFDGDQKTFNCAVSVDYNTGDWFYVKVRISKGLTEGVTDSYAFSAPVWIEPAPANTATVIVRVMDSSTGASLPAAKVLASRTGDISVATTAGIRLASATGDVALTADAASDLPDDVEGNTLPDGTLQASGLAAGTYVVSASKPGYVQTAIQASASVDGVTTIEVRLTPQSPTTGDSATYLDSGLPADGTVMLPLQQFTKTWSIANSGTTDWDTGYRWTFVTGERMAVDGDTAVSILCPGVASGSTWDVTADLKAPLEPGRYRGYWQMQNAVGEFFGPQCWGDIQVVDSTPPHTEWSLSPANPDGPDGWYVSPVTLTMTATSPDDPVSEIRYTLDGINWLIYTQPVLLPPGEHKLSVMAIDSHNNPEEPDEAVTVKVGGGPSNPNPANGATGISVLTGLSWTGGVNAAGDDLYIWKDGTTKPATPTVSGLTVNMYQPPHALDFAATYRWQVVDAGGTPGDEWTFATVSEPDPSGLAGAKGNGDGSWVSAIGLVVTGAFNGFFYAEMPERTAGIRVIWSGQVNVGRVVDIKGVLETNTDFERCIRAAHVTDQGAGSCNPIGMSGRSLGGEDLFYNALTGAGQRGVKAWTWTKEGDQPLRHVLVDVPGLNNIGLLIRTWGRVVASDAQSFWVDDGSGYDSGDPNVPGVKVQVPAGVIPPAPNSYVTVTGVSSCCTLESEVYRLVRVRDQGDITLLEGSGEYDLLLPGGGSIRAVYVPAGSFLMGNSNVGDDAVYDSSSELPQHPVSLSGYYIGKYEVTRGEYRRFMNAGGYSNRAYWSEDGWNWKGTTRTQPYYWDNPVNWGTPPGSFSQGENSPVVGTSYYEAEAFCNWAGGHLPTEAQWEKAARWTGSHPSVYPWGDTWDPQKCNNPSDDLYPGSQTAPVGSYLGPNGASPYGCQDMAGNVWEWCQDWFVSYPGSISPFDHTGTYRSQRSSGWYNYGSYPDNYYSRCATRSDNPPDTSNYAIGFRIAR